MSSILSSRPDRVPAPSRDEFPWNRMHIEHAVKLTIYPETWRVILERHNTHNRPKKPNRIRRYSLALREGRFLANGETVIFGSDRSLLDGQNRGWSSLETGIPITTWTIFGIDPPAFLTIGKGAPRSFADDLSIQGHKNTKVLASIAAVVYLDDNDRVENVGANVDDLDSDAIIALHPHIIDSANFASSHPSRRVLEPRLLGFLHLRLIEAGKSPKDILEFFDDLATGASLPIGDPVLMLRERLKTSRTSGTLRLSLSMKLALAIKAWNCRQAGRILSAKGGLRWRQQKKSEPFYGAEPFPVIE